MLHPREILGVPKNATMEQIEAAYQRAKIHTRPELFPEGSSERQSVEQKLRSIDCAYDCLMNSLAMPEGTWRKHTITAMLNTPDDDPLTE